MKPERTSIPRPVGSHYSGAMTLQQPIGSGFGAASTAADTLRGIDLTGKVAIVTGGGAGIGVETTRALRGAGATVIVPARDRTKAATALVGLDVEIAPMDLGDPASIAAFAAGFLASGRPLHILIHSAGIMATPFARDARGFESQFATNHVGHFQLATLLWPALQQANGARVVSVSSWGHRYSNVVLDDLHYERREYNPWIGYGQSKTANVLFAVALDARGQGDNIRAFALHPGTIASTDLGRYVSKADLRKAGVIDDHDRPILDPDRQLKTPEQGAATSVWCATSPRLAGMGGVYCENADIAPIVDDATAARQFASRPNGVLPYAIDRAAAEQLWTVTERLLAR
jgi:NAD(P)-dependent dehydrogenase (short-subunit alcohol dehydrogenase family)